jgi:endonuclease YncB( thermonuclease family)
MPTYDYAATWAGPADTHDGDTTYLVVTGSFDFGFHVVSTFSARQKFRLARCNAPELSTPEGPIARQFTVDWLTAHAMALRVTSLRADNYGDRWDAEVYDALTNENLSDALLASGNAVPYPNAPKV